MVKLLAGKEANIANVATPKVSRFFIAIPVPGDVHQGAGVVDAIEAQGTLEKLQGLQKRPSTATKINHRIVQFEPFSDLMMAEMRVFHFRD